MALALCRADPDDAGAVGPWLLAGAARRGESLWFTVADEGGASVGMLVLVRRPVGRAADVGFAPSGAAPGVAVVGAALRLVAREAFDELALERLETRVRTRDD